jgi:hypothetical protein
MSQAAKILALALVCAAAGCSDIYFDRRDTVALGAGDAVATNIATHTIDVWPPYAGNTYIVTDGHKAQGAVERYRTNKVTPPVGTGTSSVGYAQPTAGATAAPSVSQ